MNFPTWYAVVTALHVNGVWVDKITFNDGCKPKLEIAIIPSREYAYVVDKQKILPVGPFAIEFIQETLGDEFDYNYHVDSNIPSLAEVLDSWGADSFTIFRLEMVSSLMQHLFGIDPDTHQEEDINE